MGVLQINPDVKSELFTIDQSGKSSLDEGAFAEHFVSSNNLVCIGDLLYDNTGVVISKSQCEKEIYEILRGLGLTKGLSSKVKNLYDVVKFQARVDKVEVPINEIAVQNGTLTVDLKTGEFEFSPKKKFSMLRLNCNFNPNKPCEKYPTRFLEWVDNLIQPYDQAGFQEYMGYLLLPVTKLQKAMILLGRGQEGKSRVGLILHQLFGAACVGSTVDFFENNSFAMPRAENRLVLFQDDLKKDRLKSTETFKMMTSAEVPLQAEKKGENAYSFQPYARWVICSNAPLSALHDNGHGFFRRLYVVRVRNRPEGRIDDPFYFEPMKEEMDGIFIWLLQGLQRLIQNGWQLSMSDESKALVEEQQECENSIVPFMREELRFGKSYSITTENLYKAYLKYCTRNGLYARKRPDVKTFFDEQLDRLNLKKGKHFGENRGQEGYYGMCLASTADVLNMLSSGGEKNG